jgi:hypothetical protein
MNGIEELAQRLATKNEKQDKKWSLETARLSIRAGHRCEYCGLDFLASVDNYKLLEVDHFVPNGGERESNKAVACHICNFKLKGQYDPSGGEGGLTCEELIFRARRHIASKRAQVAFEIEYMKGLIFSQNGQGLLIEDAGAGGPAGCVGD